MTRNSMIGIGIGVLVLALMTAGASAFFTRQALEPAPTQTVVQKEKIHWNAPARPAPVPQQQAANCDDGNIVGNVLGGTAGGIAGSQLGKGKGKTAATIGGTLGGAYIGGKVIPTQNVTCR